VATNGTSAPARTQMSPRDRRRFLIGFAALIVLLFAGGMLAFVLDFRHHTICPGGATPLKQNTDLLGQVIYLCPNGKTVTQGVLP
jgi:hypothetical protein